MPGTKQLILHGPGGHLLGGWNDAIDTHLSHVLVDLEADLATKLGHPIAYNVFDSEGSGLPTALRYEAALRDYLSVLPRQDSHTLSAFEVLGNGSQWRTTPSMRPRMRVGPTRTRRAKTRAGWS